MAVPASSGIKLVDMGHRYLVITRRVSCKATSSSSSVDLGTMLVLNTEQHRKQASEQPH